MDVRAIHTEQDYRAALDEITQLLNEAEGGDGEDRLEVLSILVEAYEDENFPIDPPDPIAAIRIMMEQKGLKPRDLEPAIGSRGRVSEILNRKRPLTLPMIRGLAPLLSLPADVLIQEYKLAPLAAA